MSYNYNFRVLAESHNCLSTFKFVTVGETMDKMKELNGNGKYPQCYPIIHNTDPNRADYEYRYFDLVQLPGQVGMVLCLGPSVEPEFHGFRSDVEQALDYVDNYWYEKDTENK